MLRLSPKGRYYVEAVVLLTVSLLSFFFWNTLYIYPIKLFAVLLHECSHGLAAFLSGGTIKEMQINYQIGGYCITAGGNQYTIAAAGYLGSLLLGTTIFLSPHRRGFKKFFSYSLALLLIFFALAYINTSFGKIFTLGFAVMILLSARFLPEFADDLLLKILGLISSIYVLIDIKEDLITTEFRHTDAQMMANLTGVAAIYWGLLWIILASVILFFALKYNFRRRF